MLRNKILNSTKLLLTVLFVLISSEALTQEIPALISYIHPKPGAENVTPQSSILIKFNNSYKSNLKSSDFNFNVYGEKSGLHSGEIIISDNTINCLKTVSSSSMVLAWETAAEEARYEIAKYFEKEVQSAIINIDDEIIEKRIALETSEKLSMMKLKTSYITTELKDNLRLFKVYHEMEISQ